MAEVAVAFNSSAFRGLNSAIVVVLVSYWLFLMARTVPMVVSGELFLGDVVVRQGRRERMEKRLKEEEDRRRNAALGLEGNGSGMQVEVEVEQQG